MAKGRSQIQGVYFDYRKAKHHDALRVWVRPSNGEQIAISAKIQPTLREINRHLKAKGLRKADAGKDRQFEILWQRLQQELSASHGLKAYRAQEKINLKTGEFDFERSLEEFKRFKSNTSINHSYFVIMKRFWLPFFLDKGCLHPNDFKDFASQAEAHIRTTPTVRGQGYSHHSYNSFSKVLNQYLKFLVKHGQLSENRIFKIWITTTLEEKKRHQLRRKRTTDTYSLEEVIEIKQKIDLTFASRPDEKLIAYGLFFGICTGLRQGNILGLKAEDLFPDEKIPYFRVSDNIVGGWSRGEPGFLIFKNATKTTSEEDGEVLLPILQPSVEIACEIARALKASRIPDERLLPLKPCQVYRRWKKIARECGFKFLSPHSWKHSYATIGADHLDAWYKGRTRLLQLCCLHSSYKMTEKYVKKAYANSLQAWASGN